MPGERRLRILSEMVREGANGLETQRICDVCAEVTGMSGAGIMLMAGEVPRGAICSTNKVSALLEQLQYTLGQGPCVDAYQNERPVYEPDLANPAVPRWQAFAGPAVAAGARAVFGFPLRVGMARLGSLNLYRDRIGPLTDEQHADALVMADISAEAVLMLQANAPAGALALELETSSDFQYVVHQASGMVAAQLEVSVSTALIRIRAYAFANDRPLTEVARHLVGRKLRFTPHGFEVRD